MIWEYSEVTDEMVSSAQETSRDTLRHSLSGSDRVILKYNPTQGTPSVFDGATTYDQNEMLTILTGSDWAVPL